MALIPESTVNTNIINSEDMTDLTYHLDLDGGYISGKCDGIDAIIQSIYKILSTQRYAYIIYDRNYGFEYRDLIGRSTIYVSAVIRSRIEEALLYDSRIKRVENFEITKIQNGLYVKFDAVTKYGKATVDKTILL